MQRDDIKEQIKVETEQFKLYVWLSVLTIGGTIGLVFKEGYDNLRFNLIATGVIIGSGFICLVFYTYFKIKNLLKQLRNYDS